MRTRKRQMVSILGWLSCHFKKILSKRTLKGNRLKEKRKNIKNKRRKLGNLTKKEMS